MKYKEIEDIFSAKRMQKYVQACGGDTRRAMTLYQWMGIDSGSLLYGLDHVGTCSDKIMSI